MPPFSPHKEEAPVLAPSDELAALLRASNKMHSSFLSDSQSVDQRIHGDDCGHDHVHAVNPTPKKPLPNEDILREALQCVACNQLVDVCCSLQCGCLMCRRCAVTAKRSNELSKLQTTMMNGSSDPSADDGRAKITCPSCSRKTVLDGPLDTIEDVLVSNLAERLRTGLTLELGQQSCGRCEKRVASKECKDCGGVAYCDRCASLQHSMGALKKHKLTDIGFGSAASRAPACPFHPEERLSLFCTQDQTPVCAHCLLLGSHLNHPRVFVSDAFTQSLASLKPKAELVSQKEKELMEVLSKLTLRQRGIRNNSKDLQADVKSKIAELQKILEEKEKELLDGIRMQEEEKLKSLSAQVATVEAHLKGVKHTAAIAEAAMQECDPFAWLSNAGNMEARIMRTIEKQVDVGPVPSLSFGCSLDVSLESQKIRSLSFMGPELQGARCSRPHISEKTPGNPNGGIILSWDAPSIAPSAQESWSDFVVESRADNIENSSFVRVYRGPLCYTEVMDLAPGANYVFRVIALAKCCCSSPSEESIYRRRHSSKVSGSGLVMRSNVAEKENRETNIQQQQPSHARSSTRILDFSMEGNVQAESDSPPPSSRRHQFRRHDPLDPNSIDDASSQVSASSRRSLGSRAARNPAIMC